MATTKADIIIQLQKDILLMQGFKLPSIGNKNIGLGPVNAAFPNSTFPLGAVHEFISAGTEEMAATGGFVACILASLMRGRGVVVWISSSRTIFPPALKLFGIEPERIIFVDLQKEKDVLWAMEEALKCNGLAAVVGEKKEINFTESRRLQLAVEQSGVTGFILRHQPRNLNTIASVSRWKITPLPSESEYDLPGVGFPRWNVGLLKIRNGKPGVWQIEWSAGKFRHISPLVTSVLQEQKRKTG
jgi:protein ImuA